MQRLLKLNICETTFLLKGDVYLKKHGNIYIHIIMYVCNYNNNKHFFNLQIAKSPCRLRFEANLSRESSECTEHNQDQMSQINTGKTVYVGNASLKKYVLRLFSKR